MHSLLIKLCCCISLANLMSVITVLADGVKDVGKIQFYSIPNPFTNSRQKGFYYIKSHQTVITSQNKRTTLEVDEYFSLVTGFSYSVYKDVYGGGEYALVSDGKQGRSYIIRNPSEEDEKNVACELDAVHNHRQVFPWQFVYDISSNELDTKVDDASLSIKKKKKKKKNKKKGAWATKRSVYGVGAIWLNAIELHLVSDKIGDKSPYPSSQQWSMSNNDLTVELLFSKPEGQFSSSDETQSAIDATKLVSVNIKRHLAIESNSYYGGTVVGATADEIIEVDEFVMDLDKNDDGIKRMYAHLRHCRKATHEHKVFPSLLRAISLSPKHMYKLDYLETRFGTVATIKADNKYRKVYNPELIFELFSMKHEAQVIDYQGIINQTANLYDDRVDSYLKKFTERASGLRSTRHATVQYHIVRQDEKHDTCTNDEPDPPPFWFKLLRRPFRFSRVNDVQITGVLTGLGALLMNANDIHYKQFNLLKKTIDVVYDVANIGARMKVVVDEWRLDDQGGKRVHFYFKRPINVKATYDLSSLVRVEVREIRREQNENVVENEAEDNLNDEDLMIRWDIVGFHVDNTDESIEDFFTTPDICPGPYRPSDDEETTESTDAKDSDDFATEPPFILPDDEYMTDDDKTDPEKEEDKKEDEDQKEGEDTEFEPGMSYEDPQVPDFFEQFYGNRVAYNAVSKVELVGGDAETRSFYLKEEIDMDLNIARISVFYDSYEEKATPDLDYYANYNSEVLLLINGNKCEVAEELESWMRIFSVDLPYWKRDNTNTVSEESHKLRVYGVGALWRYATMSGDARFLGQSKFTTEDKYDTLYWTSTHDGNSDMGLTYEFRKDVGKGGGMMTSLLSLKSIRFDRFFLDSDYDYSWNSIRLTVVKFERQLWQQSSIPAICEAELKSLAQPFFHMNSNLPTFEDFIGDSKGYNAQYYVVRADRSASEGVHMDKISESHYLKAHRGKITSGVGERTRELFVDGTKGCIYLFAQNSCKLISTILAFNTGLELVDYHHNSDKDSLFGIANIWKLASTFPTPIKKTFFDYDGYGNKIRRSLYYVYVKVKEDTVKIKFEFTLKDGDLFDLNKIEITQITSPKSLGARKLYKTTIQVIYMRRVYNDVTGWNLPDECSGLCGTDQTDQSTSDGEQRPVATQFNELPDISKIIAPLGKFYMRSEIVLPESAQPDTTSFKNYHMVDEWYQDGNYRIKSYGLGKNYDEIVYTITDEYFDISEENLCNNKFLNSNDSSSQQILHPLLEVWKGNKELPNSLVDQHFGPISIWQLAETNKNILKLVSSIDLTPKGTTNEEKSKELELEMGTRVWRLVHPNGSWFVDLEFLKESSVDADSGDPIEWLILNGITIQERHRTEIDVVNYEYAKSDEELQEKLLLPEGYGCQRSPKKIQSQGAVLESVHIYQMFPHFIWYESSLEKTVFVDSDYGVGPIRKSKSVLPINTGTLYRILNKNIPPHLIIWSDYNTLRFPNGSRHSTKTIHDSSNRIHYIIDRTTGYCSISSNDNKWTLRYPSLDDDTIETLVLTSDMFNRLFIDSENFQPVNSYEKGETVYSSFEETGENLSLTNALTGPYSIIRRFQYNKDLMNFKLKKFQSMTVKVYIFDKKRIAKKAILTFNLRGVANVPLNQVIDAVDVSSCFNDGNEISENPILSFMIEYECKKTSADIKKRSVASIKDSFTTSLIDETRIYPTQLVGSPKLDMNDAGSLKFTFNLIDAPTFILKDTRYYPRMKINNQFESIAQVKISSDIIECSKVCDTMRCMAMSYCSNHFCYTVAREDINDDSVALLASPQSDAGCDYYYLEHPNAPIASSLIETMEQINNVERKAEIFPVWTAEYCGLLYPIKFTELTEPIDSEGSTALQRHQIDSKYIEFARDKKLSLSKLNELDNKGFKHSIESVESGSSCIRHCEVQNCVMVSFCKTQLDACIVVTGSGDIKELMKATEEDSKDGCVTMLHDYTVEFKRFIDTMKPASSALEYAEYSDKECAATCVLSDANQGNRCLSFDHCTTKSSKGDTSSTCYIQTTHMYSDQFERTIFEGSRKSISKKTDPKSQSSFCQHFSRNFLADYQKLAGKSLKVKYIQIENGITSERCAYNCNNDDDCYAFIHCNSNTGESCLILRNNHEKKFNRKNEALEYLNKESYESRTCSIFVRNQVPEIVTSGSETNTYFWDPYLSDIRGGALMRLEEKYSLTKFFIKLTVYLHVALIGGLVVQVIILRVRSSIL